jgi:hypothetical protein
MAERILVAAAESVGMTVTRFGALIAAQKKYVLIR